MKALTTDKHGMPIGMGSLVHVKNGQYDVIGAITEITFRESGDVMVHTQGMAGRNLANVKYVEAVRMSELESELYATFVENGVRVKMGVLKSVTDRLRLAFEADRQKAEPEDDGEMIG